MRLASTQGAPGGITAGELAELERQLTAKRAALIHLDAVLRIFAPALDPGGIPDRRPCKERSYKVPNLSCRIRDALQRHGSPMAMTQVVEALVSEMGYPAEAVRSIKPSVRYTRRNLVNDNGGRMQVGRARYRAVEHRPGQACGS